jgi:N-formylglutamate deformylase
MDLIIRHEARASALPVVASLPHSGVFVPPEIAQHFTPEHRSWLRNTDWFLPEVYAFLPALGVTALEATHSRYVIDLNRDPTRCLFGPFFEAAIAEHTAHGVAIYSSRPDQTELEARVARFHAPFHAELRRLLAERRATFSRALLLDLHSYMGPVEHEVVLGDGRGLTCSTQTTALFEQAFREHGFDVVVNEPWAGGFVVRSQHDLPAISALQIELRYPLYMDCAHIDEPGPPTPDTTRIAALQLRLRSTLEEAIGQFLQR